MHQPIAANDQIACRCTLQHVHAITAAESEGVKRWGELRRLFNPVVANRGWRQHQCRPKRCAVQQQGECLQCFAQAHIIGKTGAGAPVRQTAQPVVAIALVVAQGGVECCWNLWGKRLCLFDLFQLLLPLLWRRDLHGIGDIVNAADRQRVYTPLCQHGIDGFKLLSQARAERQNGAIIKCEKAPLCAAQHVDQSIHVQRALDIDVQGAIDLEPILLVADGQLHLIAVDLGRHIQWLAARPAHHYLIPKLLQTAEQFQCRLRVGQFPLIVGVVWQLQRLQQRCALAMLGIGIALAAMGLPVNLCDQYASATAGQYRQAPFAQRV